MDRLPDWVTDWLTDKQCARGITSIVVFHCSLGNFVAHQLKLWKLIKLKRLPRGHFRWVEIRAWSEMYGSVFCLVLRLARSSQDKPSQHASEGNLSLPLSGSGSELGEGKTFCFAFKRKLKRHAAKQQAAEIKCKWCGVLRGRGKTLTRASNWNCVLRPEGRLTKKNNKNIAEKGWKRGHVLKAKAFFKFLLCFPLLASLGQRLSDTYRLDDGLCETGNPF